MRHSLKYWKEELDKALRTTYYHPTCDFCHNELIMSHDQMEIVLFEPKEVEYEAIEFERVDNTLREKTVKRKEMRSSDPKKDIFRFKCPVCGHICEITREEMNNLRCSYYGDNNMRFELDEVETKAAEDFMKEHNHTSELIAKKGNPFFSTLGQQFSFEFIPGGLGNGVVITCNYCKESKDITNTDNW